jgi:exoribonuclease R
LKGYEIRHILEDGKICTQYELDIRLLNKYFPRRNEGSIFDIIDGEKDTDTLIAEAYLIRNEAIAWRMENNEE